MGGILRLRHGDLRSAALSDEFARLWPDDAMRDDLEGAEAGAAAAILEDEAKRLEEQSLEELLSKYMRQAGIRPPRPPKQKLTAREFQRDPLVVAIARKRAEHRCEIDTCHHPTFETADGLPYVEVHNILPLPMEAKTPLRTSPASALRTTAKFISGSDGSPSRSD